jgi:molybdate transport system substrate-binding protein
MRHRNGRESQIEKTRPNKGPNMITRRFKLVGLALFGAALALGAAPALAADTQVAVAANFTEPAKEIAAAFKAKTGYTATLSFGASGQFYTQMAHGAPYEVFLSADAERPQKAEQEGLGVAGSRYTYAVGRLVLYSKTPGLIDAKGAVLKSDRFAKLAIADPTAAPYGLAAIQTMQKLKVYDALTPKIVKGSSITQAYQYVATGNAELGFVALSQVVNESGGSRWLVPAADHEPIDQQAILLRTGEKNPAAKAFLTFLKSPAAVAIIKRYGYEVR